METLLDRHLATFDIWLRARCLALYVRSRRHYYLAVVTLLDQLRPKKFHWQQVSVILQDQLPSTFHDKLESLFGGREFNIAFIRTASKFFMDRDRAGSLWVNSHKYAGLAMYILAILCDKSVYNRYTLVRANMNASIHYRRFIDIVHSHARLPAKPTTYYEVGKLAFDLLPILLSRIKGAAVSKVHDMLLGFPTFDLIKNDPLGSEKVKAAQAIEEFLKV